MTEELFREDAYLKSCEAKVIKINDLGGIILDRTVFYPTGGGQPGDSGALQYSGNDIVIATTVCDRETGEIVHVPAENQVVPEIGSTVTAMLDWDRRYLHMRMHYRTTPFMCVGPMWSDWRSNRSSQKPT